MREAIARKLGNALVAPIVAEFRPLGAAPTEYTVHPFDEWQTISIVTAGQGIPAQDAGTRLEFVGVPEGAYLLRQQYPPYPTLPDEPGVVSAIVSDARELGIYAGVYSGRPDVALTQDLRTRVALSVGGLQPLGDDDWFELYSYQADALAYLYTDDGEAPLVAGTTSLDGWSVLWRPDTTRSTWTLPDPGEGDDLWLAQLSSRLLVAEPDAVQARDPWSYAEVGKLTAAARVSSAAFVAGEVTEVNGMLAPVAARTASFDLRVEAFTYRLAEYASATVATRCSTELFLEPGIAGPILGVTPTLASLDVTSVWVPPPADCPACPDEYVFPGNRAFDLEYANPYPGGTELVQVRCSTTSYVVHPETGDEQRLTASMRMVDRISAMSGGPIVPLLDLVSDVRVNGVTTKPGSVHVDVGTTPTVSFAAPSFGTVDSYSVAVIVIDDITDTEGTLRNSRTIGAVRTTDTSVSIPEGLMQPGAYYYLQVSATQGWPLTAPVADSHALAYSTAATGIMTP